MKTVLSASLVLALLTLCGCTGVTPGISPIETPGGDGGTGELPEVSLSGTGIAAIVALLLSLVLAYVPGFQVWWNAFAYKREVLAGAGLVVALALVGLHYVGAIDLGLGVFGWSVVWRIVEAWLAFSGMGQLTYTGQRVLRQPEAA